MQELFETDESILIYLGNKAKIIKKLIKEDSKEYVNVKEIHNIIEKVIKEHSFAYPLHILSLAFPTNINKTKNLAHNILSFGKLSKGIIKIDFGLKLKSLIIDTAISITYTEKYKHFINVLEKLFTELESFLKPNQKVFEISSFIYQFILSNNLFVISELSGHTITKQELHSKPYIYNTLINDNECLYETQVFTIEPFITDIKNYLVYEAKAKIFKNKDSEFTTTFSKDVIEKYNVLSLNVESAQIQHTFLVQKDKVLKLT